MLYPHIHTRTHTHTGYLSDDFTDALLTEHKPIFDKITLYYIHCHNADSALYAKWFGTAYYFHWC